MVLVGGLEALAGPVVGALAYQTALTQLVSFTPFWRGALGVAIIVLVIFFPQGLAGWWVARRRAA
jgi:branched-chain amino acid transport system permease protein